MSPLPGAVDVVKNNDSFGIEYIYNFLVLIFVKVF